jgi:predicted  nucleic acid-binding Zn-ribbon protein
LNQNQLNLLVKEIRGAMIAYNQIAANADKSIHDLQEEMAKVWEHLDDKSLAEYRRNRK